MARFFNLCFLMCILFLSCSDEEIYDPTACVDLDKVIEDCYAFNLKNTVWDWKSIRLYTDTGEYFINHDMYCEPCGEVEFKTDENNTYTLYIYADFRTKKVPKQIEWYEEGTLQFSLDSIRGGFNYCSRRSWGHVDFYSDTFSRRKFHRVCREDANMVMPFKLGSDSIRLTFDRIE